MFYLDKLPDDTLVTIFRTLETESLLRLRNQIPLGVSHDICDHLLVRKLHIGASLLGETLFPVVLGPTRIMVSIVNNALMIKLDDGGKLGSLKNFVQQINVWNTETSLSGADLIKQQTAFQVSLAMFLDSLPNLTKVITEIPMPKINNPVISVISLVFPGQLDILPHQSMVNMIMNGHYTPACVVDLRHHEFPNLQTAEFTRCSVLRNLDQMVAPKLETLDIKSCAGDKRPGEIFGYTREMSLAVRFPMLTSLVLNGCGLLEIGTWATELINLTFLNMDGNEISKIANLDNLANLQVLSLANNRLTSMDGLGELCGLLSLDLNNNQIEQMFVPSQLHNIRVLHVNFNDIQILPRKLPASLRFLGIAGNKLSGVLDLSTVPKLIDLNVCLNRHLSKLCGLSSMQDLQTLDISSTLIDVADYYEDDVLNNLHTLLANDTKIEEWSTIKKLASLKSLKELQVINTKLPEMKKVRELQSNQAYNDLARYFTLQVKPNFHDIFSHVNNPKLVIVCECGSGSVSKEFGLF
ncbi:hypothetical protein DASC09_054010 [Saccharomycopsis crataegensis]|uniref:F-box domain-containing protein n=1 Tax=Saccharomycopsis crataegensis TaxID=43959 RepID=A0AAV5QU80_9ASCO|nr:hypothetical protein DASC09_054010 [Saccharomycopsis crataegensis]